MEMGIDFISSNCPQLLTAGGFAIAFEDKSIHSEIVLEGDIG